MSLGRLQCQLTNTPDDVVARVNALLAPLFLTFKPASNANQIREVMGDLVWNLDSLTPEEVPVKLNPPDTVRRETPWDRPTDLDREQAELFNESAKIGFDGDLPPAPSVYVFKAWHDITALDLALLQELMGLRLPHLIGGQDTGKVLQEKGLLKYFEVQ